VQAERQQAVADEVEARSRKAQAIADEKAAEARRLAAGAAERQEAAQEARTEAEDHRARAADLVDDERVDGRDWADGTHPQDPRNTRHTNN
jgi:hypothetical protein